MSGSFTRSVNILRSQAFSYRSIIIITILVSLWGIWFLKAPIPIYQKTDAVEILNNSRIVAQFPQSALLQLQLGQSAQMYLDGLSQTEYGTVSASVSRINGSIHDGYIQVDLRILRDQNISIPLQRGLTGVLEVEIERVSPVTLLLRSIGR